MVERAFLRTGALRLLRFPVERSEGTSSRGDILRGGGIVHSNEQETRCCCGRGDSCRSGVGRSRPRCSTQRTWPLGTLALLAMGCAAGTGAELVAPPGDFDLSEEMLANDLPPGDDPWVGPEAHAGATRSVRNTVPWYPEELRRVSIPEYVHPTTLRYANGKLVVAGKRLVYAVDEASGMELGRLCIAELVCGDDNDDDFLAHLWDPWTSGSSLWLDDDGRWLVFMDAVGDTFSNDWQAKVFDLQALPGDGRIVDAPHFTLPKTNVTPWFSGWWASGGHLLAWYRRIPEGTPDGREYVLEARRLPGGEKVWMKVFRPPHGDDERAEPGILENGQIAHLRLRWPYLLHVEATGQRLVLWDLERDRELWRLPATPAGGRFDPERVFLTDERVLSYWGDTEGTSERFVRYAVPGGEVERSCGEEGPIQHAVEYPHWAASSRDGRHFVGVGSRLQRIDVARCELQELSWTELDASDALRVPRPRMDQPPLPQRAASAANAALYGLTGDASPGTPQADTYVIVWPYEAGAPTAKLGPASVNDPGQERWFVVAGHRIVMLATPMGGGGSSELVIYGDETPPEVGEPSLDEQGHVVFEAHDGGGPLWRALLAVQAPGEELRLLAAEQEAGTDRWRVDVSLLDGGTTYTARAVAIDLSGNWMAGEPFGVRMP